MISGITQTYVEQLSHHTKEQVNNTKSSALHKLCKRASTKYHTLPELLKKISDYNSPYFIPRQQLVVSNKPYPNGLLFSDVYTRSTTVYNTTLMKIHIF